MGFNSTFKGLIPL